jgi:uncharacterized protein (TIGR02453 family)
MTSFTGFPPQAIDFLSSLGSQDAKWFKARKSEYQDLIVGPARTFVTDMGQRLQSDLSRHIVFQPKANGSIAPINNDLRFSPDKPPYKDHLLFRFWEGSDKKTAATLFVRVSPGGVGFATGAAFADVGRWRKAVAGKKGAALATSLAKLAGATGAETVGQELKRVPAPYETDHPRADLLRHKMLQVRWQEKAPASLHEPAFVAWCAKRLSRCGDVHQWLTAELS